MSDTVRRNGLVVLYCVQIGLIFRPEKDMITILATYKAPDL